MTVEEFIVKAMKMVGVGTINATANIMIICGDGNKRDFEIDEYSTERNNLYIEMKTCPLD